MLNSETGVFSDCWRCENGTSEEDFPTPCERVEVGAACGMKIGNENGASDWSAVSDFAEVDAVCKLWDEEPEGG